MEGKKGEVKTSAPSVTTGLPGAVPKGVIIQSSAIILYLPFSWAMYHHLFSRRPGEGSGRTGAPCLVLW